MLFVLGMFMVSISLFLLLFGNAILTYITISFGGTTSLSASPSPIPVEVAIMLLIFGMAFIAIGIIAEEEMSEIETNQESAEQKNRN
jgi:hypothetical protein